MAFLMLAIFTLPVNASSDEDVLNPDGDSGFIASESIPGYGIVAYKISLTADPFIIPSNGKSTSMIKAQLKDRNGKNVRVKDVFINFQTTEGTLSADSAYTDNNGKATIVLTSSKKRTIAKITAKSDSVLIPGVTYVIFWP